MLKIIKCLRTELKVDGWICFPVYKPIVDKMFFSFPVPVQFLDWSHYKCFLFSLAFRSRTFLSGSFLMLHKFKFIPIFYPVIFFTPSIFIAEKGFYYFPSIPRTWQDKTVPPVSHWSTVLQLGTSCDLNISMQLLISKNLASFQLPQNAFQNFMV